MYAIVEIAGQQFKAEKDKFIYTHRLEGEEGAKVEFSNVLLIGNNDKIDVGAPILKGAKVSGKILGHLKGEKLIVLKRKEEKALRRKQATDNH